MSARDLFVQSAAPLWSSGREWRWRRWTKIGLGVLVAAVITTATVPSVRWAATTWTARACFTVHYVDLRGGYAPTPAVYTDRGAIFGGIDRGEYDRGDEIGHLDAGDVWCGPLHYGNGASYAPWFYFNEGRVVRHVAVAPQPPLVNS